MCATEQAEVEQESFWSRLPVFRSRAEFKLGPLTTPETAKQAQSESLRSRPARRVAAGMHRFAKIPAAHRALSLPRGRVLSTKGRSTSGAEFTTALKTVVQRTVRGRPLCSVDRMYHAGLGDFGSAEGGRKSFGSRLAALGFGREFKL